MSQPAPVMPQTSDTARDNQLHAWLTKVFPDQPFHHTRIVGDASFRSYHRLTVAAGDTTCHYIIMDAPPDKESIKEFIAVDKLMADVVHVPKLIAINEAQGFIVLEDLGDTDFADVIAKTTAEDMTATEQHYQQAMRELLAIQRLDIADAQAIIPDYDAALLTREMGLFTEWFLPYIGVELTDKTQTLWQNLQAEIINQVTAQPQVVVHRDFHSRNLMILANSDRLGVVDFQDAVIGAYTYDLASLLRDAYINFDDSWVYAKIKQFYQLKQPTVTINEFTADFNVMSMQRHLKVLGIFVRLSQRDGKDRYLANLPKVFADLMHTAMWLSDENAVFAQLHEWLEYDISPAFQQKVCQQKMGAV